MPSGLYLDSARFGLMLLRARRAHHDFVRLAAREGASAAVVDLLRGGFDSWPREFRRRYPDLGDWRGIGPFLQSLRALSGAPPAAEALLSAHSAPLMGLAAWLLCRTCRVILHTDLEWPPYLEILRAEAGRRGRRLVGIPARDILLGDRVGSEEVISRIIRGYCRFDADGLFLTEVTHDGIRMPIGRLVASLASHGAPRLVVVDAAQALGHTPLDIGSGPGDLYLAGCHKWVGSGLPLSLAVAPRNRTRGLVRELGESLLAARRLDDPLLRFTQALSVGMMEVQGETVNLAPLLPASAAVAELLGRADSAARRFEQRVENANTLSIVASECGWEPIVPHQEHRTGILLLKAVSDEVRRVDAGRLQGLFRNHSVALSAYPDGVLRASLPNVGWTDDRLGAALSALLAVRDELAGRGSGRARGGEDRHPDGRADGRRMVPLGRRRRAEA